MADTSTSTTWANKQIYAAVDALPADAIVVAGDASGPDEWATDYALGRGLTIMVYDKDGIRTSSKIEGECGMILDLRYWIPAENYTVLSWKERLLQRNRVMTKDVGLAHREDRINASVLALFASWSRTHGTAYTVHVAKKERLAVAEKFYWPSGTLE